MKTVLSTGFHVEPVSIDVFQDFRKAHEPVIFHNRFDINVQDALSTAEKEAVQSLSKKMGEPYSLRLGFFDAEQMVGWHYGVQVGNDTFRMVTTGILPHYQRKGIYSKFLTAITEELRAQGFQMILSRHWATDNQVIIPKLRHGFLIAGFELTDELGLLLRLMYHFNEIRRKAMHVRSGYQQPDADVAPLIRKYENP